MNCDCKCKAASPVFKAKMQQPHQGLSLHNMMYKLSSRAQPVDRGIVELHGCHGFISLSSYMPQRFPGATCLPDIYLEESWSLPELRKLCSRFSNCSKRGKCVQRFREAGTELKHKAQGFSLLYSCCCCSSIYLQILTCLPKSILLPEHY